MFNIQLTNIDELVMADASFGTLLESLKLSKIGIEGILNDKSGEIDEDTKRVMIRELDSVGKSIDIQNRLHTITLGLLEEYSKKI